MVVILSLPNIDDLLLSLFPSRVAHILAIFKFHSLSNLCVTALCMVQKWMVRVGVVVPTSNMCELGVIVRGYSFLALFIITITRSDGLGFVATI